MIVPIYRWFPPAWETLTSSRHDKFRMTNTNTSAARPNLHTVMSRVRVLEGSDFSTELRLTLEIRNDPREVNGCEEADRQPASTREIRSAIGQREQYYWIVVNFSTNGQEINPRSPAVRE